MSIGAGFIDAFARVLFSDMSIRLSFPTVVGCRGCGAALEGSLAGVSPLSAAGATVVFGAVLGFGGGGGRAGESA